MKNFLVIVVLCILQIAAGPSKDPSTVIEIYLSSQGNDIAFNKTELEASFGPKIMLHFVNKASKDSGIQHDVAILKPGTLDAAIKELQTNNYDPSKMRASKHVIAMTQTLDPGADEVLEFSPPAPDSYPYLCFMAGHADMLGMKGVLHVKAAKK